MTKLFYIFIFIIFSNNLYCQESIIVSESIIENFIKWEIDNSERNSLDNKNQKKISDKPILWKEALIDNFENLQNYNSFENKFKEIISIEKKYSSKKNDDLKNISELFDEKGIQFLKLQFENNSAPKSWNDIFDKAKVKRNPKNNYYSYTIPLFDKSFTTAILYKEFHCGSLCAYGYLNIYKKENGTWKLYKSLNCWIS